MAAEVAPEDAAVAVVVEEVAAAEVSERRHEMSGTKDTKSLEAIDTERIIRAQNGGAPIYIDF